MQHKTKLVLVLAVALATLAPTEAQAQVEDRRFHLLAGGGWSAPQSDVGERFGSGYNLTFGADVSVNPVVSIEGLYSFQDFGDRNITLPVTPMPVAEGGAPTQFFSSTSMQYGTGSVLFQKPQGNVKPYGVVGAGVYYRPVEIATPSASEGYATPLCDPWRYVCYPSNLVSVEENIVGQRSSTDFGMAFGGGVKFGRIYADLRYHYTWGPKFTGEQTNLPTVSPPVSEHVGKNANGQYFQTTFGFRF
jgi:opacity protein-like surface antigen